MWYVEREVRLGNNRTCTSKTQQWSIPSQKRQRIHSPEELQAIEIKKPVPSKVLSLTPKPKCKTPINKGNVEPLSENDIDNLADITNGKCGLVLLMRVKALQDSNFIPEMNNEVEIETSPMLSIPKTIDQITSEIGPINFDVFCNSIRITPAEQTLLVQKTTDQSSSDMWHEHRNDRVTASIFKSVVLKLSANNTIINPEKSKTVLSNVCGYNTKFKSKATDWGIGNESTARNKYQVEARKLHKEFKVVETGFHIDLKYSFLGATPDGLVDCRCHGPGVLEIKCPWTHRALSVKEYSVLKDGCLDCTDGIIQLKRDHAYYYQVQMQMYVTNRNYCDFYLCTTKDSFCERIPYNEKFMMDAISKVKVVYQKLIFPEIITRSVRNSLNVVKDVSRVVKDIVDTICDQEYNGVDFQMN